MRRPRHRPGEGEGLSSVPCLPRPQAELTAPAGGEGPGGNLRPRRARTGGRGPRAPRRVRVPPSALTAAIGEVTATALIDHTERLPMPRFTIRHLVTA